MINTITHLTKFSPEFNQMVYTARNLQFFRKRFGIDTLNDFIDFSIIYTIKNLRPEVIEFYNNDIPLNIDQVELIIRSPNEFVTHLNLPNNPIFQDRIYTSSFIQYQRIQN